MLSKSSDPKLFMRTFTEKFKEIGKFKIKIGIPKENTNKQTGEYIADIAWWNEKGTFSGTRIPPRPFGSTFLNKYKEEINKVIDKELNLYLEKKKNLKSALNIIGITCAKYMKYNLTYGSWVPNSPITIQGGWIKSPIRKIPIYIKGKKSSRPLIDTGQLRQSITYIVVKNE